MVTIFLLRKETNHVFFWLTLSSLVLFIADLVITIKINTPVNEVLRCWNGEALPDNFEALRVHAISAFYGRAAAAIFSYKSIMIAYPLWLLRSFPY